MSKIALSGNASGTGTFTIASPNTDSDATINLPTVTGGEFIVSNASGNVGIGTSSPGGRLDVAGGFARFQSSAGYVSFGDNGYIRTDSAGFLQFQGGSTGTRFMNSANDAERARIDSSGQFLNNCTGLTGDAPNAAGGRLLQTNGNEKIRVNVDAQPAFQFYSPTGGVGGPVGTVTANASSTSYNTSSDYRLKESIAPMTGALARVAALKPCTYTWKSTGEQSQGFIAHELQEVVPECVTGEKDGVETYTDEDGVEQTRPRYQGIDTSFLVATLTAAIQEQQVIIEQLKADVAELKGAQ